MGFLSLVLPMALAAAPTPVPADQVRRGPAPAWAVASPLMAVPADAAGPVFMRRQDVVVHLEEHGQEQYTGYRVRILQSAALELGNIAIAWNPAAGAPVVHDIRVYRDGAMTDVLQKTSFEVLRREGQLEAARLDGMLTAVLRIPDLRVGDELEVDMTLPSSDPTLKDRESGLLLLGPDPAPGRYHLGLSWAKNRPPHVRLSADMEPMAKRGDGSLDFRFDNPVAISPPKDAPPRYQWQRVVQYSDFADWSAVSRHFAPLYRDAAKLSAGSSLRQEAARIAAAHATPLDRAAAALKLVQQDVRYIYVGLNGGNLTPAAANETWQRRYGDCKGKTALLLALLTELGIDAQPVLVNASGGDDGLDQRLPLPQLFDHVVVRARIGDKAYWLDGTLPAVAPPATQPLLPLAWVLPLAASGAPIERIDWQPATTPDKITMFEIDARQGFDKPARIASTTIVRGVEGLQQQAQFSSLSPAQLLNGFRQQLIGDTWQVIDDVRWRYDQKAAASILTITGTGAADWDDDGNGARSMALPGGGFSPPEKRVRASSQDPDAPYYTKPEFDCRVTTVRLPATTHPRQWTSKPGFETTLFGRVYYRAFDLQDGAIRMVRASRVEQPEIDAATARRDNGRISAFDNSMGYIFYDPARKDGAIGGAQRVPATYDIDWTADKVPCAAPGKLR